MGDNIYTSFWEEKISEIIQHFEGGEKDFVIDVSGIKQFGARDSYYTNFKILSGKLDNEHNAQAQGRDFYLVFSGTDYFKKNLSSSIIHVILTKKNKLQISLEGAGRITQRDIDDYLEKLHAHFENIWRCASSWRWNAFREKRVLSIAYLDSDTDYRQITDFGRGKKSINRWVNRLKNGDLIVILDKYKYYGIAIAISEYRYGTNDVEINGEEMPCITLRFIHQLEEPVDHFLEISHTNPPTFFDLEGESFSEWETFNFIEKNYPSALDELDLYINTQQKTLQVMATISKQPLNSILYGPPGTGKTYKLQNEFFPAFSDEIKIDAYNRNTWLKTMVKKMAWWKVVAAVLYKNSTAIEVNKIVEDELIQAKYPHTKTPASAYIWNELLSYGDRTSSGLSDKYRGKYELFKKDSESKWTLINRAYIESVLPDVVKLVVEANKNVANEEVENKRFSFITFHQSYSYEDFIKGIRPEISDNEEENSEESVLSYHYHQGVFYSACLEALRLAGIDSFDEYEAMSVQERKAKFAAIKSDPTKQYAVFIDEINRGNIASIFGELITLIEEDKRLGAENEMLATLPYNQESFGVPANLYIIGTMNTADRSVEALDTALRRRFSFEFMPPKPELLVDNKQQAITLAGVSLQALLTKINNRIAYLLDNDHQIGHSYFMKLKTDEDLKEAFKNKIIPLLKEYFYNDYGKIRMILGDGFVARKEGKDAVPGFAVVDDFIAEKTSYEIIQLDDKFDLVAALQKTMKDA